MRASPRAGVASSLLSLACDALVQPDVPSPPHRPLHPVTEDATVAPAPFRVARSVALERAGGWSPIRRHLGIRSFGVNAWPGRDGGETIIPAHDERLAGHEELYVVVSGRATFTVDGIETDAP